MTNKPFGNYCHKHGKGMFSRCQDCIDELVALGIQADKDRIAELDRENARLRGWIRVEGVCNDTCTRQILGEICDGCRCGKAQKDAARGAK